MIVNHQFHRVKYYQRIFTNYNYNKHKSCTNKKEPKFSKEYGKTQSNMNMFKVRSSIKYISNKHNSHNNNNNNNNARAHTQQQPKFNSMDLKQIKKIPWKVYIRH